MPNKFNAALFHTTLINWVELVSHQQSGMVSLADIRHDLILCFAGYSTGLGQAVLALAFLCLAPGLNPHPDYYRICDSV